VEIDFFELIFRTSVAMALMVQVTFTPILYVAIIVWLWRNWS